MSNNQNWNINQSFNPLLNNNDQITGIQSIFPDNHNNNHT